MLDRDTASASLGAAPRPRLTAARCSTSAAAAVSCPCRVLVFPPANSICVDWSGATFDEFVAGAVAVGVVRRTLARRPARGSLRRPPVADAAGAPRCAEMMWAGRGGRSCLRLTEHASVRRWSSRCPTRHRCWRGRSCSGVISGNSNGPTGPTDDDLDRGARRAGSGNPSTPRSGRGRACARTAFVTPSNWRRRRAVGRAAGRPIMTSSSPPGSPSTRRHGPTPLPRSAGRAPVLSGHLYHGGSVCCNCLPAVVASSAPHCRSSQPRGLIVRTASACSAASCGDCVGPMFDDEGAPSCRAA